jgi:hypothetical protein
MPELELCEVAVQVPLTAELVDTLHPALGEPSYRSDPQTRPLIRSMRVSRAEPIQSSGPIVTTLVANLAATSRTQMMRSPAGSISAIADGIAHIGRDDL